MKLDKIKDNITSVAAVYKKVKILDGIYLFKFDELVFNADYDYLSDVISYVKNDNLRVLTNMEDPNFVDSDNKYCYSDYLDMSAIKALYGVDDPKLAIEEFKFGIESFFRIGIKDEDTGDFKIVNVDVYELKEKECDDLLSEYQVVHDTKEGVRVSLLEADIKKIIKELDEGNTDEIKEILTGLQYDCEDFKMVESYDSDYKEDEEDDYHDKEETNKKVETVSETKYQLDQLIGLDNVKLEVKKLKSYLSFLNKVQDNLKLDSPNLNMVFYGNPGTGKTTVARIIAKNLHDLGYTKNDKFGELTAKSFIAGYVGQTAIKTRKMLNKYKGGVIFIDEAYVFNADAQDYDEEALAEILKEMETHETIFIFAGYKDEMKQFIDMNPGLESRVGYHLHFKDYTLDELYEIFKLKIESSGLKLEEGIEPRIKAIINNFIGKDKFANGRFIDNLFQKILMYHANRTEDVTDIEILTTIENLDVNDSIKKDLEIDSKKKIIGY